MVAKLLLPVRRPSGVSCHSCKQPGTGLHIKEALRERQKLRILERSSSVGGDSRRDTTPQIVMQVHCKYAARPCGRLALGRFQVPGHQPDVSVQKAAVRRSKMPTVHNAADGLNMQSERF